MQIETFGFNSKTGITSEIEVTGVFYQWKNNNPTGGPFTLPRAPIQLLGTRSLIEQGDQRGSQLIPEHEFDTQLLPLLTGMAGLLIIRQQVQPEIRFIYKLRDPLVDLLKVPLIYTSALYIPIAAMNDTSVILSLTETSMSEIIRARNLHCNYVGFDSYRDTVL